MLFPLEQMMAAGVPVESILHVGANTGQERFDYQATGASPIFYVEPVDAAFAELRQNLADLPGHHAIHGVCAERAGESVHFNVASNGGQSSSFLGLGRHADLHPHVTYTAVQPMITTTVDRILAEHSPGRVPNLWVIDAQGADLHVLKGATESLPFVDGVYVEISEQPLYEGGGTLDEITRFLAPFGLPLFWLGQDAFGNGDALFCRKAEPAGPLPVYGGNIALNKPAVQSSWSPWTDNFMAARGPGGGVNGHISGFFGFHTSEEEAAWWQVDLEAVHPLNEIRIYNRLDGGRDRARTLRVLLSEDGAAWRCVHDQGGYTFGGKDGRPLRVMLAGQSTRYVRLQLAERAPLHLDEIEVY